MNLLALHLEYLLRRYDCVVIPGFGALIATEVPSRMTDDLSTILPPKRLLGFNGQITHSDGMLATSVSRRESITYEAAEREVARSVAELKRELAGGHSVTLPRVGTFTPGKGESPEFEASPAAESCMHVPYLGALSLSEIRPEAGIDEEAVANTHSFDTGKNYYIAINKAFARVAAIFCLVVFTALSVYFPATNREGGESVMADRASVLPVARKAAVRVTKTAPVAEAPRHTYAPAYYLIVASLRSNSEASAFVSNNSRSSEWQLDTIGNGLYCRVYAARSESRDSLMQILRSADFRSRFGDAWIWASH